MNTDFSKMNANELEAHVWSILDGKNIQKMPQTIGMKLVNMRSAERFDTEDAKNRVKTARIQILEIVKNLKARDSKKIAEALGENELSEEALIKRALIHASLLYARGETRRKADEAIATLDRRLSKSEGKVPFSQREKFQHLLMEAQGAAVEKVESGNLSDDDE